MNRHNALVCHRDSLYALAWQLTRNPADAQDLVQDTLLRAMNRIDQLRSSEAMLAWLRTILRHLFVNRCIQAKRGIRGHTISLTWLEDHNSLAIAPAQTEYTALAAFESRILWEAIAALPVTYRQCILLAHVEGLNYAEIAQRLGLPLTTVKTRLHRGRLQIRKMLTEHGHDEM